MRDVSCGTVSTVFKNINESHAFNSCNASWYQIQPSSCPLPSLKSKESEDPENESGSQVH